MDKKTFEKCLSNANVLLMNKSSLLYFGILAYAMKKEILTQEETVKKTGMPALAFTDGKTISYMITDTTNEHDLIFLTMHELLHIISDHVGRKGSRDRIIWNLAVDHVVNRALIAMSSKFNYIRRIEGTVFFEDVHKDNPKILPEDLYDILNEKIEKKTITITMKPCPGDGGEGGKQIIEVQYGDKKMTAGHDSEAPDGQNKEEFEKNVKEMIQKAKAIWNSPAIDKGNVPSDVTDYLDEIFEVELPWYEILQSAIMYQTQSCEEPSWARKNPYIRVATLPAYNEGVSTMTLIAVMDTSASITDDDLKIFAGVVLGSIKHFKSLIVYMHDVDVTQVLIFDREPTITEVTDKVRHIKGRGGTSHVDVFNHIENIHGEELISNVIFLTDFYSDVESIYNNYKWIKEIPTIWAVNREKSFNVSLTDCDTKTINL